MLREHVRGSKFSSRRGAVAVAAVAVALAVVASIALKTDSGRSSQPNESQKLHGPATYGVERRVLVDDVELTGTFARGHGRRIVARGFQVSDGSPIVTRVLVRVGDEVNSGTAIVKIGSEPIFVLDGKIPMYRDLTVGKSGDDVLQLQESLGDLGFRIEDRFGYFGTGTANAVASFYRTRGFSPSVQTSEDEGSSPSTGAGRKASTASYPMVKFGAFNYVARLPQVVASVDARVGEEAGGSLVTLASRSVRLTVNLADRASEIQTGMKATFELDGFGYTGSVARVSRPEKSATENPGDSGEDGEAAAASSNATIAVDRKVSDTAVGRQVLVNIERRKSPGRVTVVPVSAVFTNAAGDNYVRLVEKGRPPMNVPITVGWTADGFAVVRPAGKGAVVLLPGMDVEVGK